MTPHGLSGDNADVALGIGVFRVGTMFVCTDVPASPQ